MTGYTITIPGQTVSLKNSKQVICRGRQPRLIASKQYRQWAKQVLPRLRRSDYVGRVWRYPLEVHLFFYRQTRHRFDYINLAQGPLDLLQAAGIIQDDDMQHVIPVFSGWAVDKDNPRVELTIVESD